MSKSRIDTSKLTRSLRTPPHSSADFHGEQALGSVGYLLAASSKEHRGQGKRVEGGGFGQRRDRKLKRSIFRRGHGSCIGDKPHCENKLTIGACRDRYVCCFIKRSGYWPKREFPKRYLVVESVGIEVKHAACAMPFHETPREIVSILNSKRNQAIHHRREIDVAGGICVSAVCSRNYDGMSSIDPKVPGVARPIIGTSQLGRCPCHCIQASIRDRSRRSFAHDSLTSEDSVLGVNRSTISQIGFGNKQTRINLNRNNCYEKHARRKHAVSVTVPWRVENIPHWLALPHRLIVASFVSPTNLKGQQNYDYWNQTARKRVSCIVFAYSYSSQCGQCNHHLCRF